MDRYHSRLVARSAWDIAEVPEHRGSVVAFIDALEAETICQQRVASGCIHDKPSRPCRRSAIACCRDTGLTTAIQIDLGRARAFDDFGAKPPAIVEPHFVELGAPDLVTVLNTQTRIVGEAKRRGRIVLVGDELGARLVNTDAMHIVANSETMKQGQVQR